MSLDPRIARLVDSTTSEVLAALAAYSNKPIGDVREVVRRKLWALARNARLMGELHANSPTATADADISISDTLPGLQPGFQRVRGK